MATKKKRSPAVKEAAGYYDARNILSEIVDEDLNIALEEELRQEVVSGQHARRLKTLSIKLDPAQIMALRKIAVMKSIPYQTLIRQFLAEGIKKELALLRAS